LSRGGQREYGPPGMYTRGTGRLSTQLMLHRLEAGGFASRLKARLKRRQRRPPSSPLQAARPSAPSRVPIGNAVEHAIALPDVPGPEVAKLPPSAIWYPLGRLSRKRCSGTQGEQGQTPAFAEPGTRNFPEFGSTWESSGPALVSNPLDRTLNQPKGCAQMAPHSSFARSGSDWMPDPTASRR
jgi:hypothetical protein